MTPMTAERRHPPVVLSRSDVTTALRYLDDAAKLYKALAAMPSQACASRAHMITQLTSKIKNKIR